MMLFGIILIVSIILNFVGLFIFIKLNKITKNFHEYREKVNEDMLSSKTKPIVIGLVSKYKEEEFELLLKNPEVLDLLLRVFEYKIAINTDQIRRNSENREEKIGFVNCLHDTHLMFYNLKQKLDKEKKKNLTNLI